MRALIGQDFVRKLPRRNVDIRDTKLTGFMVRCRKSGQHSYLMQLGRGSYTTIGRVDVMSLADARAAAETFRGDLSSAALEARVEDAALTMAEARTQARATIQTRRRQKTSTWAAYVTNTYAPWAVENRKTGAETVARLNAIFGDFDALPLTEISAFAVERWRTARLKAGTTPATINRDLAALRSALTKAREWKLLRTNPLADVKAARVDTIGHVRFLADDEAARLRAALLARDTRRRDARDAANVWRRERAYAEWPAFGRYTDHLTPLVLLALNTGCRRGELFNLRWRDVDLVGARLTIRGDGAKSGTTRVIPLNVDAADALKAWQPRACEAGAYVFPGEDGERLGDIKTAFLKVLKDATITRFRFHDCRHHFASKLVQAGVDLNTVRELLGHADIKMTLRYAHLAPEHKAAAVAKLVSR